VADAGASSSFALLRGRGRQAHVFVWAFDLLALDGEDLRDLPLERRKGELKILYASIAGITVW
jgi:ATP-dependent DNA ligase